MRRLVLVNGPPASGKTTIAVPLAEQLGMPLIGKDVIKEAIYDGLERDVKASTLGGATYEVIWALLEWLPEAVVDCNFPPERYDARDRWAGLGARSVEVFCRCPADVCVERYRSRAGLRHPAIPGSPTPIRSRRTTAPSVLALSSRSTQHNRSASPSWWSAFETGCARQSCHTFGSELAVCSRPKWAIPTPETSHEK